MIVLLFMYTSARRTMIWHKNDIEILANQPSLLYDYKCVKLFEFEYTYIQIYCGHIMMYY